MGMGSVIRPILRSFDELPMHTRLLADMFRKHGRAQQRNVTDVQDLDSRDALALLDAAWKKDGPLPDDVAFSVKGKRPSPDDYLDAGYIGEHLDRFKDGASRIYFSDSLHQWGPGNDGTTFVFPTSELQKILDDTGGNTAQLADRLGLDASDFLDKNGNPVQVEIRHFAPDELSGLRMPTGNEAGANPKWVPGGYLPTGIPEAVIDIPKSATGFGDVVGGHGSDYNPGLWPGTGQSLTLR